MDRNRGNPRLAGTLSATEWCLLGKADLRQEILDELYGLPPAGSRVSIRTPTAGPNCPIPQMLTQAEAAKWGAKTLERLTHDRNCDGWYPWREGLTPTEHFQEYKLVLLERDRQTTYGG
jgi:hypothetical protein